MAVNRRSSDEPQSLIPLSFGYIHPSSISSSINRSTEPGENLKDDLLQIYARLTMFNMAVRLLKCLSYLHNSCTFIIKVLIITTNEDDDLAIGRSDMVGDVHYYM